MSTSASSLIQQRQLLRPEFTTRRRAAQERPMSPIVVPRPQPSVLPQQRPPASISHEIPAAKKVIWPIPLEQSMTHAKQHLIADMGLMMGRSFRVGWGPNWTLAHSGIEISIEMASGQQRSLTSSRVGHQIVARKRTIPYAVVIEKVSVSSESTAEAEHHLVPALKAAFAHSRSVIVEVSGIPYFSPTHNISGLHALSDAVDETFTKHPDSVVLEQAAMTLKLAVALWGRLEGIDGEDDTVLDPDDSYDRIMGRRSVMSEWLSAVTSKNVNTLHPRGYLDQLFDLVAACQIPAACTLAQRNGDYQLSMLLAESSSTDRFRGFMSNQLAYYDQQDGLSFVDPKRLKVLALLAGGRTGRLLWKSERKSVLVNPCEGMDWKQCLALHLSYGCSATAGVGTMLERYSEAFKKEDNAYAAPPLPPHLEKNGSDACRPGVLRTFEDVHGLKGVVRDICYHLLKLYRKRDHRLERTLSPATYGSQILDYFLSWILLQQLRSLNYDHMPMYRQDLTHTNFAAQLESLGLWEWAVFVLLHIDNPESRETSVRHFLARNCQLEPDEHEQLREKFVTNELNVPKEWLHEAKACRAHYFEYPDVEAEHVLKAGHWNAAHSIILSSLASDAIIEEDYDYLKDLLEQLAPSERNSDIQDWPQGGNILLDYLLLSDKVNALSQGRPSDAELIELQDETASLCSRLEMLTCQTARDRLCQAEMAKNCANYLKIFLFLLDHPDEDLVLDDSALPPVSLAPYIAGLPMLEDYSLSELRALTRSYIVELAC